MRPRERAFRALTQAIEQARATPERAIPGVRALTRSAGVSHVTMAQALAEARNRGLVQTFPGRGSFVAGAKGAISVSPRRRPAAPRLRWQRIAARIRADILDRRLPPATPLPTSKELCRRYHASAPTMRKALSHLADSGDLELAPGGYAPSTRTRLSRTAYLCLIARASPVRPYQSLTERNMTLLRELEDECTARKLRLELEIVDYDDAGRLAPSIPFHRRATHHEGALFLGFVVTATAIDRVSLKQILQQCLDTGYRTCLLEDDLGDDTGEFGRWNNLHTVLLGGDSSAGLGIGRHLLRLGHRHMAFLYQSPLSIWGAGRLQGLRDAFDEAGLEPDITRFRISREFSEMVDYVSEMQRVTRDMKPRSSRDALRRTFMRLLTPLTTIWWDENQQKRFEGHIDRLLARTDITAWVCENDPLAIRVRDSLRIRGIDVPARVSIAGFDDLAEAMFEGLTSYSPNLRGIARHVIDTLLSPRSPQRRQRQEKPVVVEGYVSERESTGAIRNA